LDDLKAKRKKGLFSLGSGRRKKWLNWEIHFGRTKKIQNEKVNLKPGQ